MKIFTLFITLVIGIMIVRPCEAKMRRGHHHRNQYQYRQSSDLRANKKSLREENEIAKREGLKRIQNDQELASLKARGVLFQIQENNTLALDISDKPLMNEKFGWCRKWTLDFLKDIGDAHYQEFQKKIRVTSAVRTVPYQKVLQKGNPNAAAEDGDEASTHLTGATIDIGKKEMSIKEIVWFRAYLQSLRDGRKIHVIEEFRRQMTFHIMVSKTYSP